MKTKSHPIDRHIGALIRLQRLNRGLDEAQLAAEIGAPVELIDQYETGVCRISAQNLLKIAKKLDVSPTYFFGELTQDRKDHSAKTESVASTTDDRSNRVGEALELNRHFMAITDAKARKNILIFAATAADACRLHHNAAALEGDAAAKPNSPVTGDARRQTAHN